MLIEGFCNERIDAVQTTSLAIRKHLQGRTRCALASMVKE
jgi:hypothetical protein